MIIIFDLNLNLKDKIKEPVIIKNISIIKKDDQLYLKSISKNGVTGFTKANSRLQHLMGILKNLVIPFFLDKDAREIERIINDIYRYQRNYKYAGMPFWNCVGHVELSLWDLLGKTVNKPVNKLLGNIIRTEIPVYLTRFNRYISPEQEVEKIPPLINKYGFKAIKLKIGGRMSQNKDVSPGYTEKLINLVYKNIDSNIEINVDANGSYEPDKAIEVGKMLQKYNINFFEEPCPWENFPGTKQVADNLDMKVAGGEQDSNLYKFKWMIENRCVNIIQPDILYNGGLIRCLQVAKIAERANMKIAPHNPNSGYEAYPLLHFASVTPNIYDFMEYRIASEVKDGKVKVPTEPGLGNINL